MSTTNSNPRDRAAIRDQLARAPLAELGLKYPNLQAVLERLGLDTCCGGHFTPTEAAAEHGLDPEQVLRTLEAAIAEERS